MGKEKIYENLTNNIGVEKFKKIQKRKEKIRCFTEKMFMIVFCTLSITGMVFAKNISTIIYDNFFESGNGIGKAVNEGYVEKADMEEQQSISSMQYEETGEKIEDLETSIKVDEFVMSDFTLDITFDVSLSDKVKSMVTPEKIWNMYFSDLIIYDENNIVLYFADVNKLNEFFKENQFGYEYNTAPEEMIIGSGVSSRIKEKNGNNIKVVFNIYTGGDCTYPKSKKLNIDMSTIKISNEVETRQGDEQITLTGNWNFSVDVPEKMYNRTSVSYIQKETSNKNFNVTKATVYDTGTDIELKLTAIEEPVRPTTPELEFYESLPDDDELKNIDIYNYLFKELSQTKEYQEYTQKNWDRWKMEKYLVNENGEKFEMTVSNRENGGGNIDKNNIYTSQNTFDLTKYDMTDTITLYVDYQGEKAEIILEKVEEK